ncbi:MAG: hypothetical protein J5J06_18280 [Phycisphaerae bacterium]|nr:hypothetical protein [Phycisphaerae bacterium]
MRPSKRLQSSGWYSLAVNIVVLVCTLASIQAAQGQTVSLELAALGAPSSSDIASAPPESESLFLDDATFVVELWVQTANANGLSSVSADISFDALLADVTAITHSATFDVLTHGTIENSAGLVEDLSGSHLGPCSDGIGASPDWVRVAILDVIAQSIGSLTFQSGSSGSAIYGTAICGSGDVSAGQISFGSVGVTLVECLADTDCDDGQFCNGAETCDPVTNTCQPGSAPSCNDLIDCTDDSCDPAAGGGAGACVSSPNNANCSDSVNCTIDACDQLGAPGTGCSYTPNDAFCDNTLYCDGVETCDSVQGCLPGAAPCTAECEHCIESTLSCAWCIFDLDSSETIGTGDFSAFAPCFGSCYQPGAPCLDANFEGDPGGCVGTSDFAAFVGCFGETCGTCASCTGFDKTTSESGRASESTPSITASERVGVKVIDLGGLDTESVLAGPAEFRLAALASPSPSDSAASVPISQTNFDVSAVVFLEVWVQTDNPNGLSSASLDLQFDSSRVTAASVTASSIFAELVHGVIDNPGGVIDDLSGSHLGACADVIAVAPMWARVAIVEFIADAEGGVLFEAGATGSDIYGSAICGVGDVDPIDILYDTVSITVGNAEVPEPVAIPTYPHGAAKQRYISFAPDALHTATGFEVVDVGSGAAYYISTPRTIPASVVGQGLTFVVSDAAPVLHDWSSLPAIHVGGCMIAPGDADTAMGRAYEIRATPDGLCPLNERRPGPG